PKTASAKDARTELERAKQGMPLFADGPVVVAKAQPAEAPAVAPPAPVVVATPPMPTAPPGPTQAEVQPPPTPPEPRRVTGLVFETADISPHPLPEGFRPSPEVGVHPSGWPLEI